MTREEEIEQEARFRYPEMASKYIAFIKGAKYADKTILDRPFEWIPIDRDENGFATKNCLNRIFNNFPCVVCSQTEDGYKYYNMVGEYLDMGHNREEIRNNISYIYYLPIPKLEI